MLLRGLQRIFVHFVQVLLFVEINLTICSYNAKALNGGMINDGVQTFEIFPTSSSIRELYMCLTVK